jgi:uncharacterized surface protein with fasciclin (FAS1) repeats
MKKLNLTKMSIRIMTMLAMTSLFVLSGCGDDDDGGTPVQEQNVWEIVQNTDNLSSLEAELEAAGLGTALSTTNNITLFAPSNAALNTLLTTLGISDFSPIRDDVAEAVLAYHVATSIKMAADLTPGSTIMTLQGEEIDVLAGPALSSGATSDAEVETADIEASNGVVHIIDVVLVPPTIGALIVSTLGTLAQPILLSSDFSMLADAIQKADTYATSEGLPTLVSILADQANPGADYTVFAPSNAVFDAAGITVETLTAEQWYGTIAKHVGIGIYEADDLTTGTIIQTAAGTQIVVAAPGAGGNFTNIFLNSDADADFEAEVAQAAVAIQSNGLIHAIAGIL